MGVKEDAVRKIETELAALKGESREAKVKRGIEEEKIKTGMENQMKAEYGVSSVKELPERWTPPKVK